MSAYRFCRTDDMALLVEAHNRCVLPHAPGEPPLSLEALKREIRERQLWCSSCMIAFEGDHPIGVLLGAKRAGETLVHRIAVHPGHLRKGHGRHLLTSLSSKLAILGPPRIVAEVPAELAAATALFDACGFAREAELFDQRLDPEGRSPGGSGLPPDDSFLVPITVDDLSANGLLEVGKLPCWGRRAETLAARKDELQGLGLATLDRIAAFVLYRPLPAGGAELAALRVVPRADEEAPDEEGSAVLGCLVDAVMRRARGPIVFPGVHPGEAPAAQLEGWGFRSTGRLVRFAATARAA